jgi:MerR family transcriptional regulator, light-induced transcriptional regulator
MQSETDERMGRHPIGVVVRRTGLSAEVLRVWERRYGVVTPWRSPSGQRLYSDADVERLRLLRRATAAGRAIGTLAALEPAQLEALVREDDEEQRTIVGTTQRSGEVPGSERTSDAILRGLEYTRRLDGEGLVLHLRHQATLLGLSGFLDALAAPLLRTVGAEWHSGRLSIAQEHLATAVVRQVVSSITAALDRIDSAGTFLVASLAGDRHEVGALLAAAAAAGEGWRVVYLGADVPTAEVAKSALTTGADAVGVSIVFLDDPERVLEDLRHLRRLLPSDIPILVGGTAAGKLFDGTGSLAGVHLIDRLDTLRETLRTVIRG